MSLERLFCSCFEQAVVSPFFQLLYNGASLKHVPAKAIYLLYADQVKVCLGCV